MLFISHRGNLAGPSSLENTPSQIDIVLQKSIDCEVDIWTQNGKFKLGHDFGKYPVSKDWLLDRKKHLWIHCKNAESIQVLSKLKTNDLNFFWHQKDDYTITSLGYIWIYPGHELISGGIAVLPEKWLVEEQRLPKELLFGVCSDYIKFR